MFYYIKNLNLNNVKITKTQKLYILYFTKSKISYKILKYTNLTLVFVRYATIL